MALLGGTIAAVAVSLLATACGSSSGSASGSSSTLKGDPIKIGVIGSLTGPLKSAGSAGGTVAPAWEKWINQQQGGIGGRPVQVIVKNDAGDAATAVKVAGELVNQHVVAIVASSDYLVSGYADLVTKAGVPLISGTPNATDWYTKTGMFPIAGHDSGVAGQVVVAANVAKAKSYADLYCAEAASCAASVTTQQAVAQKLGLPFTSLSVSGSSVNYTAQCLRLKEQGVDYMEMNFASAVAAKFLADCAQQGYKPTVGTSGQGVGAELIASPGVVAYGSSDVFPTVAVSPAVDTYQAAMKQFAADDNWHYGTAPYTWAALELLHHVLGGVSGTPTKENTLSGMYTVKDYDVNGLLPNKLTFTQGQPTPSSKYPCYFVMGIKDGALVAPSGLQPQCVTE